MQLAVLHIFMLKDGHCFKCYHLYYLE